MMRRRFLFAIQVIVMLQLPELALAQAPGTPDIARLEELIHAGLSRVYGQDIEKSTFTLKLTRAGDTASGVEVARTNDMLSIDVTPCAVHHTVLTFVNPFQESRVSDQRCGDKTYERLQVIKQ